MITERLLIIVPSSGSPVSRPAPSAGSVPAGGPEGWERVGARESPRGAGKWRSPGPRGAAVTEEPRPAPRTIGNYRATPGTAASRGQHRGARAVRLRSPVCRHDPLFRVFADAAGSRGSRGGRGSFPRAPPQRWSGPRVTQAGGGQRGGTRRRDASPGPGAEPRSRRCALGTPATEKKHSTGRGRGRGRGLRGRAAVAPPPGLSGMWTGWRPPERPLRE